jgi:hypothetical protein
VVDRSSEVQRAATRRPRCRSCEPRHRRPSPAGEGNRQLLFGGMGRLTEGSVLNIKNKSHAVTAELEVPEPGAAGVIIAQGGLTGGS